MKLRQQLKQEGGAAKMAGEFQTCWHGVDISGAGILALLLCVLSILFHSIAVGTDFWALADDPQNNGIGVNMGLWKYCARVCSFCESAS